MDLKRIYEEELDSEQRIKVKEAMTLLYQQGFFNEMRRATDQLILDAVAQAGHGNNAADLLPASIRYVHTKYIISQMFDITQM